MERIQIRDGQNIIVVDIDGNKLWGNKFYPNNTHESVDKNVLKYFDMFELSNNRTPLDNEGKYQVILDKTTNFKHYFLDGVEDFKMFFRNNGEDATIYLGEGTENKNSNRKRFRYGKIVVTLLLAGFLSLSSVMAQARPDEAVTTGPAISNGDITLEEIRNSIFATPGLTTEQKRTLYNQRFFSDILPYVNQSEYAKDAYRYRFKDINVDVYEPGTKISLGTLGFYEEDNILHVAGGDRSLEEQRRTLIHEFMHMAQTDDVFYKFLIEGLDEYYGEQYYSNGLNPYYADYAFLSDKVVDVFSDDAVKQYIYASNSSVMKEIAKGVLSEDDYNFFEMLLEHPFDSSFLTLEEDNTSKLLLNMYLEEIAEKLGVKTDTIVDSENPYLSNQLLKTLKSSTVITAGDGTIVRLFKRDRDNNIVGAATVKDVLLKHYTYNDYYTYKYYNEGRLLTTYGVDMELSNDKYTSGIVSFNGSDFVFEPTAEKKEEKLISYSEYQELFEEDDEWDEYHDPELDINTDEKPDYRNKLFNYPDGSTAIVLDDYTVIRKDKDGKETRIKLEPNSFVSIAKNGLITWHQKDKSDNLSSPTYRVILPDGTVAEQFIVEEDDMENTFFPKVRYKLSTGEILNDYGYTTSDGKRIISSGGVSNIDLKDKNGEKTGTLLFDAFSAYVSYKDNDGKNIMRVSLPDCANIYEHEDGSYDYEYVTGVTEHFDSRHNSIGCTYENGRSAKLTKNGVSIYDKDGELIETIEFEEDEWAYIYNDGEIQIRNRYAFSTIKHVYVGNLVVVADTEGNIISSRTISSTQRLHP